MLPDRFESKDKKLMAKQSYMLLNYKADSLFMLLNADIVRYTKSRLAFNLVDSHFYKLNKGIIYAVMFVQYILQRFFLLL